MNEAAGGVSFSASESSALQVIREKLRNLRRSLEHVDPTLEAPPASWYRYLVGIKFALGNLDSEISFVACLMAKEYLSSRFGTLDLDVGSKSQSAAGLDIDCRTSDGRRIVGEVKTTFLNGPTDLGAAQRAAFIKDFDKLRAQSAHARFFFMSEELTSSVVRARYSRYLTGSRLVLLPDGPEIEN